MALISWIGRMAAATRRWREDQATLFALARLDPRAQAELETLIRLRRDGEFESKRRSVPRGARSHLVSNALRAHS